MTDRLYVENAHVEDTDNHDTGEIDRYAHLVRLADV